MNAAGGADPNPTTGRGAARACPVCGSAVTDTQGNKRDSAAGEPMIQYWKEAAVSC